MRAPRVLAIGAVLALSSAAQAAPTRDECIKASEDAQLLRIKSQLVSARAKLLVCTNDSCPKLVKKDCGGWLDEVDHGIPTVVLGARDPDGKDLVDVRVTLDGNLLTEHLDGKAIAIDPGNHTLRFEANGHAHEEPIVAREGEKDRNVSVTLGEPKARPPVVVAPLKPLDSTPEAPTSRAPSPATWVIGGLGLATLAASGVVGLFSLVQRENLYNSCGQAGTCQQSDVDQVYLMYDLAYAGAAIGGAFLLTGVILYFTTRPAAAHHVSASASGLRITF
jgi:hypothetical protein